MTILEKKQMSEEDIKLYFITPAIQKGWKDHITMETKITDGRINIRGNIVARSKPKFADYMLYRNDGSPIRIFFQWRCFLRASFFTSEVRKIRKYYYTGDSYTL